MILNKLDFIEKNDDDYWEIKDLNFGMFNLIVGLNATGKTRLVNIISNLAKLISQKPNAADYANCAGDWKLEYKNGRAKFKYHLKIAKGKILYEEIKERGKILLKREGDKGTITSITQKKKIKINPPPDELVVHVRRDIKEFPFLEDLFGWSTSFRGYKFGLIKPGEIILSSNEERYGVLHNLSAIPSILKKILAEDEDGKIANSIINDFSSIGYNINKVDIKSTLFPGLPNPVALAIVQENDLKCVTDQTKMSEGMYRAFSLIIIIHYLLKYNKKCTIVVDDLGEGLDFERSSELISILMGKLENSNIQFIVTSNDRFLMNAVDVECINILERKGHEVSSYNYLNSKEKFDEFKYTGLNNFDLLSTKMYK